MHNLSEGVHNNKNKFENINTRVTKLLERAKISNSKYMLKKLIQDFETLEKYYSDKEYRRRLESACYLSSEYFELGRICEQEEKVREKLNLPHNCTIRYEKLQPDAALSPELKSKLCDPNNPKLRFVNTTESRICGIPKTIKNVTTATIPTPTTSIPPPTPKPISPSSPNPITPPSENPPQEAPIPGLP